MRKQNTKDKIEKTNNRSDLDYKNKYQYELLSDSFI